VAEAASPSNAAADTRSGLWATISRHPLWSGLIIAVVSAILGAALQPAARAAWHLAFRPHHPLVLAGYGPARPIYWCKTVHSCDGADHVVFNSYINNAGYGDERDFVQARRGSELQKLGGYSDVLSITAGEVVLVRLYIDNAAWEGRVAPGAGVAHETRVRVEVPLDPSQVHYIYGYISANNARPRMVWDGITLESKQKTVLHYVFGSGQWWRGLPTGAIAVPDALMEDGTPLGSNALNGEFGDSFGDSGFLTFKVRVARA
jgi:hypothetical protein